jgi:hypothetical protein
LVVPGSDQSDGTTKWRRERPGVEGVAFEISRERLRIIGELWAFMKVRKKWWLGPIVVTLALLGLLIVTTQGSAVMAFIYPLF